MMLDENLIKIKKFLTLNGIRPSIPRIRIYEYLAVRKNHPSVEMIYEDLYPSLASLSKTTVYNTLKLFIEKNIILSLYIEGAEARFDANIADHGHFKCQVCGEVYDFDFNSSAIGETLPSTFRVSQRHLYFFGICDSCS